MVHRRVGVSHQRLGRVAVARIERDPDAHIRVKLVTVDRERLGEIGEDARGDALGLRGVGDVGNADDELVAAQARDGVLFAPRRGEARRYGGQQHVADGVAERIVDVLEAVEIEEEDRELAPAAMRAGDRLSDAIGEQRTVRQAGERIVVCHVHDPLVGEAPFRDLGLEPGVCPRELLGPRFHAPLERALHLTQRLLAQLALAILTADDAVGVLDEDEHDGLEQRDDDAGRHRDLPLRALDLRDERRDVLVDLEND